MNRNAAEMPPVETPQYDDPGRGPAGATPDLGVQSVVGVFDRPEQADEAARALRADGHAAEDITVVAPSLGAAPARGAGDTESGAGTVRGILGGALLGGVLGLAASVWVELGAFGQAEAIVLAAGGALGGGALGALAGSFAGLGTPTRRAERYEEATRGGGVQVAVKVADAGAAERAQAALLRLGASGVQGYQTAL